MAYIIPPVIKKFYDTWNIESFILVSFLLQAILIMLASFRKRVGNGILMWFIWVAYLLADWTANYAVGLIFKSQDNCVKHDDHSDIIVFWAPFLLLHLGGPDNITAFALEDNALWLRHLVGFLAQVAVTVAIIGRSIPRNELRLSTVCLLFAGTSKYYERTRALYHANLKTFRESLLSKPDPGPDYAKHMERISFHERHSLPAQIEFIPEHKKESNVGLYIASERPLDDIAVVKHAYHLFDDFKGLIVDLVFSFDKRDESRFLFHRWNSSNAFEVLAAELNFMYDILYTKVVIVRSWWGCFARVVSWFAIGLALSSFYSLEKHNLRKIDVRITYTLLFGAIGLEIIALLMFAFSDWTVISLENIFWHGNRMANIFRYFVPVLRYFLTLRKIKLGANTEPSCFEWAKKVLMRRWSESIYTYNLINYCLNKPPKKIQSNINCVGQKLAFVIERLGLEDFYDRMIYVSKEPIVEGLWDFIFKELKRKSYLADDPNTAKRICSARGDWVLLDFNGEDRSSTFMSYVADVDYDQSLIIWHIATDLCYRECDNGNPDHREISKTLSNYMLYLLVMQPTMMSSIVGIGQIRFRDTCAEGKRFFNGKGLGPKSQGSDVSKTIFDIKTYVKPIKLKGDKSKSVFFDGSILAQELLALNPLIRWELMSKVWVELLSYAASHCKANIHATQLSKGGELISFVWLLMTHLGIGDQFQINEAAAKLIVGK